MKNICIALVLLLMTTASLIAGKSKAPEGFTVTTYAGVPNINSAVCVTATPDGRVFVGVDPTGSLGKQQNEGSIVCCIDKDGDGVADEFTKFADVDHARGMYYNDGALWVMHPPTLSVFYDRDGDNVVDDSKVLIENFSTDMNIKRGADHTTNGFGVGIDGWLYIAVGDFGFIDAKGTDGTQFTLHGGGILRVRPDGTEMEMYVRGTRNIYDVAIDPFLNAFTRENTDDGGGWNVRLNHMVGGNAHYGYPVYYNNFKEDMIPTMKDYGGGSGVGALFVYEPETYHGKYGNMLYTLDWGRQVFSHDLTPNGATFNPEQSLFFNERVTSDMAVDGKGSMFVSVFGGGFGFNKNRGIVYQLKSKSAKDSVGLENLDKKSKSDLITLMRKDSHTVQQSVQKEILKRGSDKKIVSGLEGIVKDSNEKLASRVAAIFTLKQLLGEKSHKFLEKIANESKVREFALKALADRKTQLGNVSENVFIKYVNDTDPRVRLQVSIGLGRIGNKSASQTLLKLTADSEYVVAHTAVKSLVALGAIDECLTEVSLPNSKYYAGALKVLYGIHDVKVVNGLVDLLPKVESPEISQSIIAALLRLYNQEKPWDYVWWQTRPNNRGPYFEGVKWQGSDLMVNAIKAKLKGFSGEQKIKVALGILKNRLKPELFDVKVPANLMINYLPKIETSVASFEEIALSKTESLELRLKAFKLLQETKINSSVLAQLKILGDWKSENEQVFKDLEEEFVYSTPIPNKHLVQKISWAFVGKKKKLINNVCTPIALKLLLNNYQSVLTNDHTKAALTRAFKDAADSPIVYEMIAELKIESLRDYVLAATKKVKTKASAKKALASLDAAKNSGGKMVMELAYEDVLEQVLKEKGDVAIGEKLFIRQSCIVCHSVNMSQPAKGPYLGTAGKQFSRKYMAEAILKPNKEISQGFQTVTITMNDKRVLTGFVIKEVDGEVELRDMTGVSQVLPEHDIVKRESSPVSMMPPGLAAGLTVNELASLLDYLQSLNNY